MQATVQKYKCLAKYTLQRKVDAFNESINFLNKGRFEPIKFELRWGFDTVSGKKVLFVGDVTSEEVDEIAKNHFLDGVRLYASLFSQRYAGWSQDSLCEASFHIIKNEDGYFQEMQISSINMPVYRSEEATQAHLRKLMEDAKEEHTNDRIKESGDQATEGVQNTCADKG